MVAHKLNNEYDVKLCALSLFLDQFQKEDKLFAAQCVWWLATVIQYTEILSYYQCHKISPSKYNFNLVVTPLPNQLPEESLILVTDSPGLVLDSDSDIEVHSSREKLLPKYRECKQAKLHTTHSGRIFKNK